MKQKLFIATNNGGMGGGEVMLLNIARAARAAGFAVTVVGPAQPAELVDAAADEGFSRVVLPAQNRKAYMAQLRLWSAKNRGDDLLWCNGLVPSFATAGQKNRIVHLHQLPVGKQKWLVKAATNKALKFLVPSHTTTGQLPGSQPLYNWVAPVSATNKTPYREGRIRIGFLGRPASIKGTHTLAVALRIIEDRQPGLVEFVLGGESKFVDEQDQALMQEALQPIAGITTSLGWITPDHFFSSVDAIVVPSEVEETFGLVAAEAMSARTPLIVSDAGALPEVVGESYPYIVPQGQAEALAEAIENLAQEIKTHSPLLEDTVNKAFWRWQENFSPEAGKARVAELLSSLTRTQNP